MNESWTDNLKKNWPMILIALIGTTFLADYTNIINLKALREDNYIENYINCTKEISDLKSEINILSSRLLRLEISSSDMPFPRWKTERDGTIIQISESYEELILRPAGYQKSDLINTKGEIFGENYVNLILKNEYEVLKFEKMLKFEESLPGFGPGTSYKYPYYSPAGKVWGVSSMWIPENLNDFF